MKRATVNRLVVGVAATALLWHVDVDENWIGPRYNASGSIPLGFYWYWPTALRPAQKCASTAVPACDAVVACLPPTLAIYALGNRIVDHSSICANGAEPVAKFLAATSSDVVEVSHAGVRINGSLWPMSWPYALDAHGPRYTPAYRLAPRQVLLMGFHPVSWDGRYTGSILDTAIIGTWHPLLTWKG
jgi:type IV secretory pathway protease TraF